MEGEREAVTGFSYHNQHMGDGKMVIFGLMQCVAWKGTQGVFVVKNSACVCPTVSPLLSPPSLLPHFLPILFVFKRALRGSRRRCKYTTHTLTRRGRLDVHTCEERFPLQELKLQQQEYNTIHVKIKTSKQD